MNQRPRLRIGFTGTQKGMTDHQRATVCGMLLRAVGEFHHGDCVGADAEAHRLAVAERYFTVSHPPINQTKRAFTINDREEEPEEYLDRNKSIVRATQVLIAAPFEMEEQRRSGTWSTVRFARTLGRPIRFAMPDGTVRKE